MAVLTEEEEQEKLGILKNVKGTFIYTPPFYFNYLPGSHYLIKTLGKLWKSNEATRLKVINLMFRYWEVSLGVVFARQKRLHGRLDTESWVKNMRHSQVLRYHLLSLIIIIYSF